MTIKIDNAGWNRRCPGQYPDGQGRMISSLTEIMGFTQKMKVGNNCITSYFVFQMTEFFKIIKVRDYYLRSGFCGCERKPWNTSSSGVYTTRLPLSRGGMREVSSFYLRYLGRYLAPSRHDRHNYPSFRAYQDYLGVFMGMFWGNRPFDQLSPPPSDSSVSQYPQLILLRLILRIVHRSLTT